MSTRRVAAIDCGTNSIRLLISDLDEQSMTLTDLDRRMTIVRLGQDVDRTGRLAPDALERTFAACDEYAAVLTQFGSPPLRFVATSASRDASNRDEFVKGVQQRLGVEPEVVSGNEEAALSFSGAVRGLGAGAGNAPYLVVDIGGGSTEFVRGFGTPEAARSVDVGCVRMTERHLRSDPPTEGEIEAAEVDIQAAIDRAAEQVDLQGVGTLIGVAGTVTTVSAINLGLPEYDSLAIHGSVISASAVRAISADLLQMTHTQRSTIPVMHPGRVDVIGAGSLILRCIVDRVGANEVVVSETDILDGICWSQVL